MRGCLNLKPCIFNRLHTVVGNPELQTVHKPAAQDMVHRLDNIQIRQDNAALYGFMSFIINNLQGVAPFISNITLICIGEA